MTLATEADPVETVRLALDDNTTNSDWSNAGAKPGTIEKIEATRLRTKMNRSSDALYLWSADTGDVVGHDANWTAYDESQFVSVSAMTKASDAQAHALTRDIREIIASTYATDNFSSSNWQYIRPITEDDLRHEKLPNRGDTYSLTTVLELFADRDV